MITIAKMSDNANFINSAYEIGVRNFRFNMDYESEAIKSIFLIRDLSLQNVSLFADFQGVKMRIHLSNGLEEMECSENQIIQIHTKETKYPYISNFSLYSEYVKVGDIINFSDGKIEGIITEIYPDSFKILLTKVRYKLRENAGCTILGRDIPTPHITPDLCNEIKKNKVIRLGLVNWVILSFVESPEDIQGFVNDMHTNGIKVMAKIETPTGVHNIDKIIPVVDGIMIGRGDLSSTSGSKFEDIYTYAINTLSAKTAFYCGIGTFFLSHFSQTGITDSKEITEIEELRAKGFSFIMLSKEVVNSNYPFQTVKFLQELCQK